MSGGGHILPSAGAALSSRGPTLLGGAGMAGVLALATVTVLDEHSPSTAMVAVAGLGLLSLLALSLARYEAAAVTGFVLLAAVQVEPAPCDAVFAVLIAVAVASGRLDWRRAPAPIPALVALLLVLNVLSTINVVDTGRAAEFLGITLYLAVFALWLTSYVDRPRRARSLARAYVAAAAASATLSSLALFAAFPGSEQLVDAGARARGLFQDPNVFGPFLVPAALIAIEELVGARLLRIPRSANVAALVALVVGIVLSYSRAAWLNLAVAVLVMVLVYSLRRGAARRLTALVAVVLAGIAAVAAVVSITGSGDFLEERARFQSYDTERFGNQRSVVELAGRHPLGVGPGQVEVVSPLSAHSSYVRVLGEQGALGFVAFMTLVGATLLLATRNVARGRGSFGIGSAALLAAWCGLLVNSAFVDTVHWRHLWLVAALIWAGAASRATAPASG